MGGVGLGGRLGRVGLGGREGRGRWVGWYAYCVFVVE